MTITYDKQILIKRGNTAMASTYVGPLGELVLDTDTMIVYSHDGVTVGGTRVGYTDLTGYATENYVDSAVGNISFAGYATESYVDSAVSNVAVVDVGNITFTGSNISAANGDTINIQAKNASGNVASRFYLDPVYNSVLLEVRSSLFTQNFKAEWNDWATGVWEDYNYGSGRVTFTNAYGLLNFFQNTLGNADIDTVKFVINGQYEIYWDGSSGYDVNTGFIEFYTDGIIPDVSPSDVTTLDFTYTFVSKIEMGYDNNEIKLEAKGAGVRIDASTNFYNYVGNNFEVQAGAGVNISATSSLNLQGSDLYLGAQNIASIRTSDQLELVNSSNVSPISIITDDYGNARTWSFNPNGTLSFPDTSIQSTAWLGFNVITSENWANPAPTTLNEAIDRLAQVVKTLNGGTGA